MENREHHLVNFPDELIEEILSRLPVKSLLCFKCVSKSWYSLVSDPKFIKNALTKSTNNTNFKHHNFILQSYKDCETKHCSVHSLQSYKDWEPPIKAVSFDEHPFSDKSEDIKIWGACNGLICIGVGSKDVYLWNPAMKKSKKLPSSGIQFHGSQFTTYGLGYEEANDDYKVVAIHGVVGDHMNPKMEVRIYSSTKNCWKIFKNITLPNGIPSIFGAIYVNGKFHFQLTDFGHPSGNQMNHIGVLDLSDADKKIECRNLIPPMGGEYSGALWTLCEVNGSLFVLCDNNNCKKNDLWKLRDNNSWSKMLSIPYMSTNHQMSYSYRMPLWLKPNSEEILISSDDGFGFFNAKSNSFKLLETHFGGYHLVGIYVGSLVFPFDD